MDFGKILRRKREERNLTQAEVAERIGISHQNVDSCESGYKIPSMRVVIATADLFHCSTDEMIGMETYESERQKAHHNSSAPSARNHAAGA